MQAVLLLGVPLDMRDDRESVSQLVWKTHYCNDYKQGLLGKPLKGPGLWVNAHPPAV